MKALTKLTLTALFAASALTMGSAHAADHAKVEKTEAAKMDCSRLPADATNEQLTLCLQSLRYEQSARQDQSDKAFAEGRRRGYEEGFQAARSYSPGYRGGYGGD
ncbi:MAG TPA: hypothetical protein PLZ57_02975 [Pseudobdellovibrionaceae bacterium]|nr:hypothetical protein [Pseudobdellovibrionaceae bacterium]